MESERKPCRLCGDAPDCTMCTVCGVDITKPSRMISIPVTEYERLVKRARFWEALKPEEWDVVTDGGPGSRTMPNEIDIARFREMVADYEALPDGPTKATTANDIASEAGLLLDEIERLESELRCVCANHEAAHAYRKEERAKRKAAEAERDALKARVEELENKTPLDRLTTFLEAPIEEFFDEIPVCYCGAPSPDGATCWKCIAAALKAKLERVREWAEAEYFAVNEMYGSVFEDAQVEVLDILDGKEGSDVTDLPRVG